MCVFVFVSRVQLGSRRPCPLFIFTHIYNWEEGEAPTVDVLQIKALLQVGAVAFCLHLLALRTRARELLGLRTTGKGVRLTSEDMDA